MEIYKVILYTIILIKAQNVNVLAFPEDNPIEVHPRILSPSHLRHKRSPKEITIIEVNEWVLKLSSNYNFKIQDETLYRNCSFLTDKLSNVAITKCDDNYYGIIRKNEKLYFLEPTDVSHVLYELKERSIILLLDEVSKSFKDNSFGTTKRKREKRNQPYHNTDTFNLTGDVIELPINDDTIKGNKNSVVTWRKESLVEDDGYFLDTAWEVDFVSQERSSTTNAPPPHLPPLRRWLEISLAVDHTVISFHGEDRVHQYVLALMNVVSAIYKDPSLDSHLGLVITRLTYFNNSKDSMIKERNAKHSLESVNKWNLRVYNSLRQDESRHDVAIWLTRADIGGPSGYAPVSGVCDPRRSCALNRDEGFTSAFIIAHEMAHILGLSHDGDVRSGNNCTVEASKGGVMAPMVAATFHKFVWSKCSRDEFHARLQMWKCLNNKPHGGNSTALDATVTDHFSMDEQCRMEFGEGYSLCKQIEVVDLCTHLWCGHVKSPDLCKTKKGPPLAGTTCGFDKWCMSGYCSQVGKGHLAVTPVKHTPMAGRWGKWSSWGSCSRTCGLGVAFRTRKCNNPSPAFGGKSCEGRSEDFRICNVKNCPDPKKDLRGQQCARLARLVDFKGSVGGEKDNRTWLPYEDDSDKLKCQLTCASQQTGEVYYSGENLIDGTPCSYERDDGICVQGVCQDIGCDGALNSRKVSDYCGICEGDGSLCRNITRLFKRTPRKASMRITVLPKYCRNIQIEIISQNAITKLRDIVLRNRRHKKFNLTKPNDSQYNRSITIAAGARFHLEQNDTFIKLAARGPVLGELIVLLPVSPTILGKTSSSLLVKSYYTVNTLESMRLYKWVVGGWSPCSASCGGGNRTKTVACRDTRTQSLVLKDQCSLLSKPLLETSPCNQFSCDFHWLPGDWGHCSATCGSHGVESRDVYCVHNSVNTTEVKLINGSMAYQPWRYMLVPTRCSEEKPITIRSCNRFPCVYDWVEDAWTPCSTSCEIGFKSQHYRCQIPKNETMFSCAPRPPAIRKLCRNPPNLFCKQPSKRCVNDTSKYCSLKSFRRYCMIPSYRKLCCKTCANNSLPE